MFVSPQQRQAMRLGCKNNLTAPIVRGVGAIEQIDSYSRIVGTQRVKGQNDIYPDCVPTAYCNGIANVDARSGGKLVIPETVPLEVYKTFDPTLTTGMNPEDLFAWGMKNDLSGYRLQGWSRVDHNDELAVRGTIKRRGFVFVVIGLSLDQQNQIVCMPTTGPNGVPGTWGWHAECSDGCDGSITSGTSWGASFYMDRMFFTTPGYVVGTYELNFYKV